MSISQYVQIVARGKGRARVLTQDEAQAAMSLILAGNAEPEAVGALLMVLRLRGETDTEIAGFTAALRATTVQKLPSADLDWPCYAAGRTRGAPLFLLSAKLVSQAGYRVALHGWNSHQGTGASVRAALDEGWLLGDGLFYHALEDLNPVAFKLLKLRDTFGLRSCFNTVLRMWNPANAAASVQGVFHPSYRSLQARAAALLCDQDLTIIKGGGGEFERNPTKDIQLFGLRSGQHFTQSAPATLTKRRRLSDPDQTINLHALWSGHQTDEFSKSAIIGTAALALWTIRAANSVEDAETMATDLWQRRNTQIRKSA